MAPYSIVLAALIDIIRSLRWWVAGLIAPDHFWYSDANQEIERLIIKNEVLTKRIQALEANFD